MNEKNRKIEQKDVNNAVWAVCSSFRRLVNPVNYREYLLVMLFLKYISDVWKDHYENYCSLYSENEDRIRRRLERERFVLPYVELKNSETCELEDRFLADFYSLYERRASANIGELINIVLDAVEEKNKAKLEGVFRNIDFNSEAHLGKTKDRNRRLKTLLEDFHQPQLNMSPGKVSEHVIGRTYVYLIERFASDSGKKARGFYTPQKISELMAKLARPKSGSRICDPACGSGGILIEVAREVKDGNFALFGMESNGSTWALARMNMFLHGADFARIEWCDALNNPALVERDQLMKFDIVVSNPPFFLDKWCSEETQNDHYNRFWRGMPPKNKAHWAFISHMVESALEKKGCVVVVAPHGVLFRGGSEGRIRTAMIEENLLDAVISLPGNLFLTTAIPAAILIFDRSREKGGPNEYRKEVLFIDASHDYLPGKNQNAISDDHIRKIVGTVNARQNVKGYAHLATFTEIQGNNFNLNVPRYVDISEAEENGDSNAAQDEIDQLEEKLREVRAKMAAILKEIE